MGDSSSARWHRKPSRLAGLDPGALWTASGRSAGLARLGSGAGWDRPGGLCDRPVHRTAGRWGWRERPRSWAFGAHRCERVHPLARDIGRISYRNHRYPRCRPWLRRVAPGAGPSAARRNLDRAGGTDFRSQNHRRAATYPGAAQLVRSAPEPGRGRAGGFGRRCRRPPPRHDPRGDHRKPLLRSRCTLYGRSGGFQGICQARLAQ